MIRLKAGCFWCSGGALVFLIPLREKLQRERKGWGYILDTSPYSLFHPIKLLGNFESWIFKTLLCYYIAVFVPAGRKSEVSCIEEGVKGETDT
jgi:hypothetical protein